MTGPRISVPVPRTLSTPYWIRFGRDGDVDAHIIDADADADALVEMVVWGEGSSICIPVANSKAGCHLLTG